MKLVRHSSIVTALIVAIPALVIAPAAAAGRHVTKTQVSACYPDAIRLCGAPRDPKISIGIGERLRIIACMFAHVGEVSQRCKQSFGR
jgi:hypothetical protein